MSFVVGLGGGSPSEPQSSLPHAWAANLLRRSVSKSIANDISDADIAGVKFAIKAISDALLFSPSKVLKVSILSSSLFLLRLVFQVYQKNSGTGLKILKSNLLPIGQTTMTVFSPEVSFCVFKIKIDINIFIGMRTEIRQDKSRNNRIQETNAARIYI